MNRNAKIFVTGHRGMVGSAIVRRLQAGGYTNLVTRTHAELDLLDQRAVHAFLSEQQPDYIFIAAASGGWHLSQQPLSRRLLYENLQIEANLIHGAHAAGVQRLMFPGSSCIYPRDCPQPIKEEYLSTGPLEPTNEPCAIARIAGIKLAERYNSQLGRQYVIVRVNPRYFHASEVRRYSANLARRRPYSAGCPRPPANRWRAKSPKATTPSPAATVSSSSPGCTPATTTNRSPRPHEERASLARLWPIYDADTAC